MPLIGWLLNLAKGSLFRYFSSVMKAVGLTERKALVLLTKNPAKFVEYLGTLNTDGRKRLSEALTEASKATLDKAQKNAIKKDAETTEKSLQGNENVPLNSTWIASGSYEPTDASGLAGYLTLHLLSGKSYIYPAVSRLVWETMKAAKGNPGAGTAFWALYLRGARTSSPGFALFRSALKLSGLQQRVESEIAAPFKSLKKQAQQKVKKISKITGIKFKSNTKKRGKG